MFLALKLNLNFRFNDFIALFHAVQSILLSADYVLYCLSRKYNAGHKTPLLYFEGSIRS